MTRKLLILSSLLTLALSALACGGGSTAANEPQRIEKDPSIDTSVKPATELPAAEAVLARAVEATGGEAAYRAVKSYSVTGTFAIPAQKIVAAMMIRGGTDGRFLIEIKIPGIGTERIGSDGKVMWSMSAMTGSRILAGAELEQMRREVDLLSDINWKTYYKSATTKGIEDVGGKPAHVVEMIDNADLAETRYYDVESGLLVRQTGVTKSQMGEMKSDSSFSNYTKYGDLMMAKTTESKTMGMVQVITSDKVELNPELDDKLFALPDDIVKLTNAKATP